MSKHIGVACKTFIATILLISSCVLLLNIVRHFGISLIIFLAVLAVFIVVLRQVKRHYNLALLLILFISLALRLGFATKISTPVVSDFSLLYNAAKAYANGDLSHFKTRYFLNWAYQTPFVLYQAAIIKIIDSALALKVLNVIFMVCTNCFIYLIASNIANKNSALICSFLYAIYPEPILYSSVLTNQHMATCLFYAAIYVLIAAKKYSILRFALSGLLFSLANLIRPESIIAVAAVIITSAFLYIKENVKANKRKLLICTAGFLAIYFICQISCSILIRANGINSNGISNRIPEWKFICGLNAKTNGTYSSEYHYVLGMENDEEIREEALRIIKSNIPSFKSFIMLLCEKFRYMWSSLEDVSWSLSHIDMNGIVFQKVTYRHIIRQLKYFDNAIYIFIWLGVFITSLYSLITKDICYKRFYLILLILLNIVVYMLIENQIRYRYNIMPALFILLSSALADTPDINVQLRHKKVISKNRRG